MSELKHVVRPAGMAPGNGYSHVVWGTGTFVAVSGQVALDERGELVGPGDAATQAAQVFENLRRCLAEAGATFADVVKFTFRPEFLVEIEAFAVLAAMPNSPRPSSPRT